MSDGLLGTVAEQVLFPGSYLPGSIAICDKPAHISVSNQVETVLVHKPMSFDADKDVDSVDTPPSPAIMQDEATNESFLIFLIVVKQSLRDSFETDINSPIRFPKREFNQ